MTDTDRTFYDAAMAEADVFAPAGYAGPAPRPGVPDAARRQLAEAWADRACSDAALADEGLTTGPASHAGNGTANGVHPPLNAATRT